MTQTIATISQADGPISVERDGQTIELHQGDGLYETDIIKTGETSAELIFADESRATLGPKTTITLSDFAFGDGQEPSMVVDMSMGLVHFLSGKVVEQNPEAFQLITPKATVGIRGTGFVYKITLANGETFFLTSIGEGHDVVVTDRTGQRLILDTPGQGTVIDDGIDETIEMREFSPQEVKEFVDQIKAVNDVLELEEDDDEKSILDSEGQDDEIVEGAKTTVTTLFEGDEAEAQANVYALQDALEEAGVEATVTLVTFEPPVEEAQGENPPLQTEGLPPVGEGSSTPSPDPFTSIDGTSSYYADTDLDLTLDSPMQANQLRITGDITADITIAGDFKSMSGGTITAGNDIINGQNMANGTIVGDGESVSGGTLISGVDTISLQNKSGGNSIYGDIESATGGNISFAADNITITGDFSNSAIYGDAGTLGQGVTVQAWGGDVIIVEGTMGDASGQASTTIYGDVQTGSTAGGADTISVAKMVGANTSIDAGGGDDNVTVTDMQEGTILLGEGADTANIGGIATGTRTIDMGLDSSTDTINLDPNGSGAIIIKNINALTDKVFLGTTDVTADVISGKAIGNYGPVQLVDPVGVGPIITFNESATNPFDGTNDGNIAFKEPDTAVDQVVRVSAVDSAGQTINTFFISIGDTSALDPTSAGGKGVGAGEVTGTYGIIELKIVDGDVAFSYDATAGGNKLQALTGLAPGAKGTDTFTIYAVDADGKWTAKVINVEVEADGAYTFNGTAGVDSIDAPGILTNGGIDTLGGNDYVSLGGIETSTGAFIDTGADNDQITLTNAVSGQIRAGEGNDVIKIENAGGPGTGLGIEAGDGDDQITIDNYSSGIITAGDGNDSITVGGVSGNVAGNSTIIDVTDRNTTFSDTINLNGSGAITIDGFTIGVDTLFIDGQAITNITAGQGTYGSGEHEYVLTFTDLTTGPPTVTFQENSGAANDGNIEFTEGGNPTPVVITATSALGSPIADTTKFSATSGAYGNMSFQAGAGNTVEYVYTVDSGKLATIKPGEIVTDTITITVDDGTGGITTKDVTIRITGDGNYSFTGTSGNDTLLISSSLTGGDIALEEPASGTGTNHLTVQGNVSGHVDISGGTGNDTIIITGDVDGDVPIGYPIESVSISLAGGDDTINIAGTMKHGYINAHDGTKNITILGGVLGGTFTFTGGDVNLNIGSESTNDQVEVFVKSGTNLTLDTGGNAGDTFIIWFDSTTTQDSTITLKGFQAGGYAAGTFMFDHDGSTATARVDITDKVNALLLNGTTFFESNGDSTPNYVNFVKEGTTTTTLSNSTFTHNAGAGDQTFTVTSSETINEDAVIEGGLGSDSITVNNVQMGTDKVLRVYGDNESTAGGQEGDDTIRIVKADLTHAEIYGDGKEVDGGEGRGGDIIIIEGNIGEDVKIYGDAISLNNSATLSTGDDIITVKGVMSSNAYIDAGHGVDTITVGSATQGMTGGTIRPSGELDNGDTDSDTVTVYVGNAAEDAIMIEVKTEDRINLHDAATNATNVSIKILDDAKEIQYFSWNGTDLTTQFNAALQSEAEFFDPGSGITIHFA